MSTTAYRRDDAGVCRHRASSTVLAGAAALATEERARYTTMVSEGPRHLIDRVGARVGNTTAYDDIHRRHLSVFPGRRKHTANRAHGARSGPVLRGLATAARGRPPTL